MSISEPDKISNLWKKSREVNDIYKTERYNNPAQTPYKENVFNESIFSDLVPDKLPGNLIQVGNQFKHPESCEYLDSLYFNNGIPSGDVPTSGPNAVPPSQIATLNCQDPLGQPLLVRGKKLTSVPHLTFYHKVELYPHPEADGTEPSNSDPGFPSPGYKTKTTWYLPDANDINLSALRDTINFKKGTRDTGSDYTYKIWTGPPGSYQFFTQKEADTPYSFVFDNKNGYFYIYGKDDQSNWDLDATGPNHSIFVSLIRYEGSKGASGSGGSLNNGLDVSFNNVDISNNLNFIHNDTYSLETGILQSKKMLFPMPLTSQSHENSVIIATVSGADDEFLNATGYYTVEIHDANYEEYNTKIHFIAGIITKENTNANYIPPPADIPLVNDNSSSSNGGVINDNTTQNVAINPIEQQLSVQPEQVTIQPITLEPITINPIGGGVTPPIGGGVTPTIDSDDDGGTSTVTVNQNTTPTNIEYTGFIKVLSCDRQYYNVGTNFGIEYIQLIKEINSNTCHICLKLDSLSTLPSNSQNSIVFNVRLYKNSLNIMNDFNKLQWTLVDARIFTQTELIQNFTFIKSLYIAGVPDNTLPPLYPNFPTESFNATTQYTVIDNSVNIERELYIKGDINMVKNNHINLVENNKIKSVVNDLYEYKIFDNNDLTSTNIPNGSWQTIATIEPQSAQSALTDQRSAYAMFEIIDRSNAGTQYKFVDNLSFIVNFTALSSGSAHANITLLSKNPTGNASGDVGYIEQIRVLCGRHNSTSSGASNGGANIQIRRICNNTGVGNTDIRVSMYNNYKGLNTKQEMNPFVLTSVGQTMQAGSTRTATINIEDSSFGFASTDSFTNKVSFQTMDVTNLYPTNIEMSGYLDMNGNELRGLNGLTINGNLDMNGYNILENTVITSGNNVSSLPRISQTTDIDILVDDEDDPVITIGSGTTNGQTQQIYFNCGAEVNLDMNDIEIKNTDLISKIMDTHKEETNRAYVQQFNFNTATLPTTTRSDNLQPPWEIGGSAGDGDWITIGVTGSFIKDANAGPPYIGDGANKWRVNSKGFRANALFELIDRTSGHHHTIKFYAGFKFGKPSIRILNNNTYSNTRFGAIRIVYGAGTALGTYVKTTYTGCVLQFQLLESSSQAASSADIEMNVWQNTENNGWKISRESVIIKENNPRCYVPTSVAQEYMKYNPIPNPPPIYSGPNGDGNYIPVGGSPYQYNLTIDTSEDLVLGTNNIYKGEKIITDELNAKDGSSFVKLAKEGEGIQIYGDAGSLGGLLAQSSNNGTNKNVFTINPNANTHTTFEVKLKHGPSSNRVETSGLSVNQDNIKLKVPLNLSTTTADILSGTYGAQTEYGKFDTLGSNIGVELAASNTIGKNIINGSGSTLYGQLPVIRTREPYTSGGGAVDNNYVMISETCYNLVSRYGLTDMFMDGPATSDPQSNNRRRFHGNDNAPTGSNATNFYSVGLIQSFKGEDLRTNDYSGYEAGEFETPFRGKGWFTGCAFGWPQKSSSAGPLQVRGNAKLRLIVNGKTVIEWTSSNPNSVNGTERTYNFSNVVLDLPSEDWVYCGNELEQSSLSDYPNDNVYNSNLKFTTEGTSLIYFQMVFPGPRSSNNYIEFPDDDNMGGGGTDSSLIRMNAFFASYPKLK